jgi:hypothetical protein
LLTKLLKIGIDMKKKLFRGERGGATVEFAIIAILLLTVVFGIIEFGILMFDQHVLTNASREGARAGIVMRVPRLSKTEIEVIVNKYAKEHMVTFGAPDPDMPYIDPTWVWHKKEDPPIPPIILKESSTYLSFGDELEVKVTYDFDFLFLSIVGMGPITLTAETRMRME